MTRILLSLLAKHWAALTIFAGLTSFYFYVGHLRSEAAQARYEARVAWQNFNAAQATTVRIEDRYRRLVTQMELEQDSLQRELEERPVVRTEVTITAPEETVSEPVEETVSNNVVSYIYQTTVADVKVEIDWLTQEPPVITVMPKPLVVSVDLACSEEGPVVDVRTDRGDPVEVSGGSAVDPSVCNDPPVAREGRSRVHFLLGVATGILTIVTAGAIS